MGNALKHLHRIGMSIGTSETIVFYFPFGDQGFSVMLNLLLGPTPLNILPRDFDPMELNHNTLSDVIERPEEGYIEKVESWNDLRFMVFSKAQLKNADQNLGHFISWKAYTKYGTGWSLRLTRKYEVRYTRDLEVLKATAVQSRKTAQVHFFLICDSIIVEFNDVLHINVVSLQHENILHVIAVPTNFQNGVVINMKNSITTWKGSRKFWIDLYTDRHVYIHTDAKIKF